MSDAAEATDILLLRGRISLWADLVKSDEGWSGVGEELILDLLKEHNELLDYIRETEIGIRKIEWGLVRSLTTKGREDYDKARSEVRKVSQVAVATLDPSAIQFGMERLLLPELREEIESFLVKACGISRARSNESVDAADPESLFDRSKDALKGNRSEDVSRLRSRVDSWKERVKDLSLEYHRDLDIMNSLRTELEKAIAENASFGTRKIGSVREMLEFLHMKTTDAPNIKDLSKPTIVLVGGTSGTGKSTISQHISKHLRIPIHSSTDVIAREPMRRTLEWILGKDTARTAFPELFGSSFDGDLRWFYAHSISTMASVSGAIEELVRKNTSAVIEGVPLIPGLLPETVFAKANVVRMTVSVSDPEVHLSRFIGRDGEGMDRGGSTRYRAGFGRIRTIHDRLRSTAKRGGVLDLENDETLKHTLSYALDWAAGPFSDRGDPFEDELRDSVEFELAMRVGALPASDIGPNGQNLAKPDLRRRNPTISQVVSARTEWLRERDSTGALSSLEACDLREMIRSNVGFIRAKSALLVQQRAVEMEIIRRLASLPGHHYDDARSIVKGIFKSSELFEDRSVFEMVKSALAPELSTALADHIASDPVLRRQCGSLHLDPSSTPEFIHSMVRKAIHRTDLNDEGAARSLESCERITRTHETRLREIVKRYGSIDSEYRSLCGSVDKLVSSELSGITNVDQADASELLAFMDWCIPKFYDIVKLKDLGNNPTIVIIEGPPSLPRSDLASAISCSMSIPVQFTSEVICGVVGSSISFVLGNRSKDRFPELFADRDKDEGALARSYLTSIGLNGAVNRLAKENCSAVISGGEIVPGMISSSMFDKADIQTLRTFSGNECDRRRYPSREGGALCLDLDEPLGVNLYDAESRFENPYSERHPGTDPSMERTCLEIDARRKGLWAGNVHVRGALLTDIDDTLLGSGIAPTPEWTAEFSSHIRTLVENGILWVPLSGVSLDRLEERLFSRMERSSLARTIAYLGDGSSLHVLDHRDGKWIRDPDFERSFSDAQACAVLGSNRLTRALLTGSRGLSDIRNVIRRVDGAITAVEGHNSRFSENKPIDAANGLVGELEALITKRGLKETVAEHGFRAGEPISYFRGGSVSWMMLGDISAEPYEEPEVVSFRGRLIDHARERLQDHSGLADLGEAPVHVPFPGSRGIKFILKENDKARAVSDLIARYDLTEGSALFIGNELFDGGNDNMLRGIKMIKLVSVGKRADPGIVHIGGGEKAGFQLIRSIAMSLQDGKPFDQIVREI